MKKTIKQQIRKRKIKKVKLPKEEHGAGKIANASIPFIEGLSQEVRRIAQAAEVESTFCATTLPTLKSVSRSSIKRNTSRHLLTRGTCVISLKFSTILSKQGFLKSLSCVLFFSFPQYGCRSQRHVWRSVSFSRSLLQLVRQIVKKFIINED